MNVHEYVSMEIMAAHNIDTPASKMAETPAEAEKACAEIMGGNCELFRLLRIYFFCSMSMRVMEYNESERKRDSERGREGEKDRSL